MPFDEARLAGCTWESKSAAKVAPERRERVLASPRFRDGQFRNTTNVVPGIKGNPLPTLGEYFFSKNGRVPPAPLPIEDPRTAWAKGPETGFRATWLGHSTVLLEMDGYRVLTDPVFGERASPVSFAGPKRFHKPPVPIEELPDLDAVLLSHDHYDHLCAKSVQALGARGVPIVTSLGVGARLETLGVPRTSIVELDWWETHDVRGLRFTAAPAQHFSGRGLSDRNQTLWSSWALWTSRHKAFFSGDTGLTEEFVEVGERLGPFDLVMLEVGAFHPSWGDIHLGPENALKALDLLGGAEAFLPVHWSTFNLGLHPWEEPAETLIKLAPGEDVKLVTPRLGAPMEPSRVGEAEPWWRAVKAR